MEARSRMDPLKTTVDQSTDDFEVVRQSRLELLTLRKQRRKVRQQLWQIEVMTEQLSALEQMYVDKVEENMTLRAENTRLTHLGELYESEKDEQHCRQFRLLEQIELLKEKALNNKQQMQQMYYTIEQLRKFLAQVKRSTAPQGIVGAGKQQIIDKMTQLQSNVADLSYKLDAQNRRKGKQDISQLNNSLRVEKNAARTADERLKLMQYQVDQLKQQNSKLARQKEEQAGTIRQMKMRIDQLQEQHNRSLSELNIVTFKKLENQPSHFSEPKKEYIDGMNRALSQLKYQELQKIDELIESHSIRSIDHS